MTIQPGAVVYTQSFGSRPENVEVPHIDVRAPTANDVLYPVGKRWIWTNTSTYELLGLSTSNGVVTANWQSLAGGSLTGSSLAVTGTATAGTGFTATTGNITATNGNFVASTAGTGIVLNSGTASGTTAATLNGRSGQITITSPSIAAGATFTFTITNSAITASTTQVIYNLVGGTTGSAVSIQSVTNSAGSSVIVLQNATAVTANTGSFVLTFLVLN